MLKSRRLFKVRLITAALLISFGIGIHANSSNAWDKEDQALNVVTQPYSWGGISTTDSAGNTYQVVPFTGTFTTGNISVTAPTTDRWAVAKYNSAGEAVWVTIPANASLPIAGIAVDASGNVYISGDYHLQMTVGPSTLPTPNGNDAWVGKMNSSGTMLWAKQIGGPGSQWAPGVGVDASGNVYVSGGFRDTTSFGEAGSITSQGDYDIFLAKLNSSGTFQWATSVGDTGDDNAGWMQSLAVDSAGNSYVTGQIQGTVSIAGTTLTSAGAIDAFVGKVNSAGVWQWAKSGGSSGSDNVYGVALDSSNNVYISGRITANATFGGISVTHLGGDDGYVAKLNSSGVFQWAKNFGGSSHESPAAMAVDVTGSPILVGWYASTDFQVGGVSKSFGGDWDGFVAKWNTNGTFQWVKTMTGPKDDEFMGVGTDSSGNIYVSGYLTGPGSVSIGSNPSINFAQGCTSNCSGALVWKLSPSGGVPTTTTVAPTTPTVAPTTTTTPTQSATPTTTPTTAASSNATTTTTMLGQSAIPTIKKSVTPTTSVQVAPEVTSAVDTNSPTSTSIPSTSIPEIADVAAGEASATVDGKVQKAEITKVNNQLVVSTTGVTATISSVDKNGKITALDGEGNLRLIPGDSIEIQISGLAANKNVDAWLFSTPTKLGSIKTNSIGKGVATFSVPTEVTSGNHRLALNGQTASGEQATLTVGVMVGEWKKGANVTVWLIVLPIVLAIAGALILPATRRRRSRATAA